MISKRFLRRLLQVLGILAIIVGFCCLDAFYYEPNYPRLVLQEVQITGLPESLNGLKIVHLSDLHIVKMGNREKRALRLIRHIKPDIICMTGDYIEDDGITPGHHPWQECADQAYRFASKLHAKYGVYAVLGNWDRPKMVPEFERLGIHMIGDQSVMLPICGHSLNLTGAGYFRQNHKPLDPKIPSIVLDHYPESIDVVSKSKSRADLLLAGHWHGGQVSLLKVIDKNCLGKYSGGIYRVGVTRLYVSRGLGMHTFSVRFNCPSEVTLIVLRPVRGAHHP